MPTHILMSALSSTMEEGKLARWLVKEGERVKLDEVTAGVKAVVP